MNSEGMTATPTVRRQRFRALLNTGGAGAMGSNCAEPQDTVRTMMQSARTVRVIEEDDWSGILEVQVTAPRRMEINDRNHKRRIARAT